MLLAFVILAKMVIISPVNGGKVIDICDGKAAFRYEISSIYDMDNQSEVVITSPGHPNAKYPNYQDCTRLVRFQEITPFRIEFIGYFEFDDPYQAACIYDFIEIKNGEDEDAPLILKACGTTKPKAATLMGTSVWMRFKSDLSNNFKGFSLKISKLARSEDMMANLTVNGTLIPMTSALTGSRLFEDNSMTISNISKELSGSHLFQLNWDDRNSSLVTISSDQNCAVVVAVWQRETRPANLMKILLEDGWILKDDQEIWWYRQDPITEVEYGRTKGIYSKTIQANHSVSINRKENSLPISIFVVKEQCSQLHCNILNKDGDVEGIMCGNSEICRSSAQWCSGPLEFKQSYWSNNSYNGDANCYHSDLISCGNEITSPLCKFCPNSKDNGKPDWCSGNCKINGKSGFCEEKIIYAKTVKSHCEAIGKVYGSLNEAKLDCSSNDDTSMILDVGCKYDFLQLCNRSNNYGFEEGSNCVHSKVNPSDDEICIDVKTLTNQYGTDTQWRLGTCESTRIIYSEFKNYLQRCCLKPGNHTLSCINKRNPYGWGDGYIEILGHPYCDDFMSYKLMQTVTIRNIALTLINDTKTEYDLSDTKSIDTRYIKRPGKTCNHYGERYRLLQDAKQKCSNDEKCQGVRHDRCSEWYGRYQLCYVGNAYEASNQDCIYDKTEPGRDRPQDGCPINTLGCKDVACPDTCFCEDHCSWKKCKLQNPPLSCVGTSRRKWYFDEGRRYWKTILQDSMVPINGNVSLTTRNMPDADKDKLNQKIGNGIDIGLEEAKNSLTTALFLLFGAISLIVLLHSPKQVIENPKTLVNRAQTIFSMGCFTMATYYGITQVVRYIENKDLSVISKKTFNAAQNNKYPTFSICLKGKDIFWENEHVILEQTGMTSSQYVDFWESNGWRYIYNESMRLYKKEHVDVENIINNELTQPFPQPRGIIIGARLVAQKASHSIDYGFGKESAASLEIPFRIAHYGSDETCFTRDVSDEKDQRRIFDEVVLNRSLLDYGNHENLELKIIFHYPGQFIEKLKAPVHRVTLKDLTPENMFWEGKFSQVSVLKNRPDSYPPCYDGDISDDMRIRQEAIKRLKCLPMFWKDLEFGSTHEVVCKSREDYRRLKMMIASFTEYLPGKRRSCTSMDFFVLPGKTKLDAKDITIKVSYMESTYQETENVQDFTFESFFSSLGGFVGIFLGYSMLQIPEILSNIPSLLKSLNISTIKETLKKMRDKKHQHSGQDKEKTFIEDDKWAKSRNSGGDTSEIRKIETPEQFENSGRKCMAPNEKNSELSIVPEPLTIKAANPIQFEDKEIQTNFGPGMFSEEKIHDLEKKINDHFKRVEKRLATSEEKDKELEITLSGLERRFTRVYGKKN